MKAVEFRAADFSDRALLRGFSDRFGENSCQHSFVNMVTLGEKYGTRICTQDGFLLIHRSGLDADGFFHYLFPMGEGDPAPAVEALLRHAHDHGARARFFTVTEEKAEYLRQRFPGRFAIEERRDYAEYIYRTRILAELPGGEFKSKRRGASLRRTYGERLRMEPLRPEDVPAVLDFEDRWLADNAESHDETGLLLEQREIRLQLSHFEELELRGVVLRLDGAVRGFAYGAPIGPGCVDELAEKGDRELRFVYQLLQQSFAEVCADDFPLMNVEEDLGIPGLRAAKLSYHPDILLRKFSVTETDEPRSDAGGEERIEL